MQTPLATYLHDHIAGAQTAIAVLKNLKEQHEGESLGKFAAGLNEEVQKDLARLEQLADRIADEGAKPLKKAIARIAAKGFWSKLHRKTNKGLGTLEALELLTVGIWGKRALWRALKEVAPIDARLRDEDFDRLAKRAQDQHDRVERYRLQLARSVLMQPE